MKWPFVSRGKHEMAYTLHIAVRDQMQARIAMAEHNLAEMRRMYDALMAEYSALRVSGANNSIIGIPPAQRPQKPADEAIETVVARFGGNSRLRRQLQKFVYGERMKPDADEDKIADRVLNWTDPEADEESA